MYSHELTSPTQAKLAQDEAQGHTRALLDVTHEQPAGSRTPEDEATLQEWGQEGQGLRRKAADLQPAPSGVLIQEKDGTLNTPEAHHELVASGEIRPTSGPTS